MTDLAWFVWTRAVCLVRGHQICRFGFCGRCLRWDEFAWRTSDE